MNPRNRHLVGVVVMSALLVLYFVFVGIRAFALFATGSPVSVLMGAALLILPLIGAWALWRELKFGLDSTRLADRLEAEGRMPEEPVTTLPSGRPVRADADAAFPRYKQEVEDHPASWQAWMRLGIVYDACGDRKRARGAIREAIALDAKK